MYLMTWLKNPTNLGLTTYDLFNVEHLKEILLCKYGSRTVREDIDVNAYSQVIVDTNKSFLTAMFQQNEKYSQIIGFHTTTTEHEHTNTTQITADKNADTNVSNIRNTTIAESGTEDITTDNSELTVDDVDIIQNSETAENLGTTLEIQHTGGDIHNITVTDTTSNTETRDITDTLKHGMTTTVTKSAFDGVSAKPYEITAISGDDVTTNTGTIKNEKGGSVKTVDQQVLSTKDTHTNSGENVKTEKNVENTTHNISKHGNANDNRTSEKDVTNKSVEDSTKTDNVHDTSRNENSGTSSTTVKREYTPEEWEHMLSMYNAPYEWLAAKIANAICKSTLRRYYGGYTNVY